MSFNLNSIDTFRRFNLKDLQAEISQSQELQESSSNPLKQGISSKCKTDVESQINIENLGNTSNSQTNPEVDKYKLKETQNTTILVAKSQRNQETEILTIFKRIYQKILSSYLKQINSQDSKNIKKADNFESCEFYSHLHLQIYFSAVNEIINRTQIEISQKKDMIIFFENFQQTKTFIIQTFTNGFQQINTQFIYIIKMLLDEIQQILNLQEIKQNNNENKKNVKKHQQILIPDNLIKMNPMAIIQRKQLDMKKQLQDHRFFQKVFFDKRIKFINGREVTLSISDQKLQQFFSRFMRLYSHLLIKLICVDLVQIALGEEITEKTQALNEKPQCCDLVGNWFLSNSCAKSFNSINSLASINLNNLNQIKIYNSKPDLWSSQQQDNCDSFLDDVPFFGSKKRKF